MVTFEYVWIRAVEQEGGEMAERVDRRSLMIAVVATPLVWGAGQREARAASFVPHRYVDPYAAAAPTALGRKIQALAVDGRGRLFPGYGDYRSNIGPIAVHYLDPRTGEWSDSLLAMPTESTQFLKAIGGRIFIPSADPRTHWEGGQPYAYQTSDGTFAMSGWSNLEHGFDICKLPAAYGPNAYAVHGEYIDATRNVSEHAVYLTFDNGHSFRVVQRPSTTSYDVYDQVCFVIGESLYVTTPWKLWCWTGQIPEAHSSWDDYFTEVPLGQYKRIPASCNNHQVAQVGSVVMIPDVFSAVGPFRSAGFDGSSVWQVPAFDVVASDGEWFYGVNSHGLYRSRDSLVWYRNTGTTFPSGFPPFLSLAVDETTVWGGTAESEVWAFAPVAGPWVAASADGSPNRPPVVAVAPAGPRTVTAGATLTFDGRASHDPEGGPLRYEWRTSGVSGVASAAPTYARTFTTTGRYAVELTVIDSAGLRASQRMEITVLPGAPPVATFTPRESQTVSLGKTLTFDGSASHDPNGGVPRYEWRSSGVSGVVSTAATYRRTFSATGRYAVELTVINQGGVRATKRIDVEVVPPEAPVATFTPGKSQTVPQGTALSFDASGSHDPDGGPLRYEWRSSGVSGVASTATVYRRTFGTVGRFGVQLTVVDDEGARSTKRVEITVVA